MKKRTEKLNVCATMPPLPHGVTGQPFDISKSEAAAWIVSQPDILQYVFDRAKSAGLIAFDPDTRLWTGVDHKPGKWVF